MRDPIVAIALAGTSRQERVKLVTGTPVDALLAELPEDEVERAFLLGAGAWAVYRQAGTQAQESTEIHEPAATETLRECSPGAALLISRLLNGEQANLLPEALERMSQYKLRLPFRLLPLALNTTGKETRAALFPLLGERGRWLSQFNSSWKWVNNHLALDEDGLPEDAETIWQEGTLGQRIAILRRQRAADPARALAWLEGVWKQEKAEARGDLLETLEVGLNSTDEPFLENALDDRANGVRATAALLLAHLPNSTLNQRMRERGQHMLQMINGRVRIEQPGEFEKAWLRDGMTEKPPRTISQRSWWLFQILTTIEPTFWESHLHASPAELLELLPSDYAWKMPIIEGWSKAAITFGTQSWLEPLWSWWYKNYEEAQKQHALLEYDYREQLLKALPGPMAERLLLDLLKKETDDLPVYWPELLSELPKPWSVELARLYLHLFREHATVERIKDENFNPYGDHWFNDLSSIALALPPACFAEALRPLEFPENTTSTTRWQIQYAENQFKAFTEIVHMRQKIQEEII
ncbi:MAG TPA: DUF5691 domain-containing protein [Ktedonobacteraceae bacterium]